MYRRFTENTPITLSEISNCCWQIIMYFFIMKNYLKQNLSSMQIILFIQFIINNIINIYNQMDSTNQKLENLI